MQLILCILVCLSEPYLLTRNFPDLLMSKSPFMVDLHCHPNIKSFQSGHPKPQYTMWDKIEHNYVDTGLMRMIRNNTGHIHKQSQCSFNQLLDGNVRVINLSLYPFERGFVNLRNVPGLMIGKNSDTLISHIAGIDERRAYFLRTGKSDYFKELKEEYKYVVDGQGPSPDGKRAYQVVNNYKELKDVIDNKPNTVAVIISVEGCHALGTSDDVTDGLSLEEHKELLTDHIRQIKNWDYPPFTMNLAHHFWNGLGGQATSFKAPVNNLINQNRGLDKGLNELGRHVLRELISDRNGKRVVIDTKHMSVASRKEYYGFVRNYNYLVPDNKIPIITSHSGVNGYKDMDTSLRKKDNMRKSKKSVYHKWSINVSNEEIRIIAESEGLIGVMMDKGLLGGTDHIDRISAMDSEEKQRMEFCKLIWHTFFQIVEAVGDESGWNVPSIGTDYDGTITHIDPYDTAEKMPLLYNDLITYLEEHKIKQDLWYDYKPKQMVDKIFNGNAMNFYKKYFK